MEKLNIVQASLALGLSQDVIRRRLRSGEISGERIPYAGGFRWLVDVLDVTSGHDRQGDDPLGGAAANGQAAPPAGVTDRNDLVEMLKGQVLDLRDQLTDRAREISELHQLLAHRSLAPGVNRAWWQFWRR